ncbi:MAG: hypothetical protein V4580_02025 [Bacteroidota bacterium]
MTEREQLDEVWETVYYTDELKKTIRDIAPALIEFLIVSLLEQGDIEVGLFHKGKDAGSCIAYDIYNMDKVLEVRYNQDTSFEMYLALEDDEGEMQYFYHALTDKEIKIIPEGLQMLMRKA